MEHKRRNNRRAQGSPTAADVARAAGVSPMTVSRVVNRDPGVAPTTRERIEGAIASLGYVPNKAARSLAGGRECRIALVYNNPSAAYLSELLVGSLTQANASGAQLVVELWAREDSIPELVARLEAHRIDGAILPAPLCEDVALLDALNAAGMQIAQISPGRSSPFAHVVTIDDFAAARTITAHLVTLGHRRIGFIAGNPAQSQSVLRQAGYEQALRDATIPLEPSLTVAADFSYRSGLAATERLLAGTPRPTAIFASNDDMAAAAVSVAHRLGLDVPRDLTVCGYDDTAMATTVWPELTTVRQPIAKMASHAVRLIVEAVRAPLAGPAASVRHVELDFEIVVRGSDGAPPTTS